MLTTFDTNLRYVNRQLGKKWRTKGGFDFTLPGVPKKAPDIWFGESWKGLYLHDLFLYFLNPYTST